MKTELEALEEVVEKLLSLKIKSEFELSVAKLANNYQKASYQKAKVRYKIYTKLYDYIKGVYTNLNDKQSRNTKDKR